jgi:hypothetical protein
MFPLLKVKFHNFAILNRILFWLTIGAVILLGTFYVYLKTSACPLVEQNLTEALGRQVRVGSIDLTPPVTIVMRNFEVVGILKSPQVLVRLGVPFYRQDQVVISELRFIEPLLQIARNFSGQIFLGDTGKLVAAEDFHPPNQIPGVRPWPKNSPTVAKIIFKNISVERGNLTVIDHLSGNLQSYKIREWVLNLINVTYPLGQKNLEFYMGGDFPSQDMIFSETSFASRGWVNLCRKDLSVHIICSRQDRALVLSARMESRKNDLRVKGRIQIDQDRNPNVIEALKGTSLGTFVIGMIQSVKLEAVVNFAFQTKMDDFKIEDMTLSGHLGYDPSNDQSPLGPGINRFFQQTARPLVQRQK